MFEISVIICSYNPNKNSFERTLNALRTQSLSYKKWQLLLIDNASRVQLSNVWDLSWQPNAKHIREEKLGLTAARLCGIKNASGKLFLFVDDDNVLASNFLETSLSIAKQHPLIGTFGGQLIGEFEVKPPSWMKHNLGWLAVRDVPRNVWSNLYYWQTTPAGAGMLIKSEIARMYAKNINNHPLKQLLGRKGNNTISAEDVDMAYTGIDMGYSCGRFKELSLIHIIPKQRLEEKYLIKLHEGIVTSKLLLDTIRTPNIILPKVNPIKKTMARIYRLLFKSNIEFKLEEAKFRALKNAKRILLESDQLSKG